MKPNKLLAVLISLILASPIYAKASSKSASQVIPKNFHGTWGRIDNDHRCENFPIIINKKMIDQTVEWKKLKKVMNATETTFIGLYAGSAEEEEGARSRPA